MNSDISLWEVFSQFRKRGCRYEVKRIRNSSFRPLIKKNKSENFREDILILREGEPSPQAISFTTDGSYYVTPVQKGLIKQLRIDNVPMVVFVHSLSIRIFPILFFSEQADEYSAFRCKELDGCCSVRIFVVDCLQSLHPGSL